MLTTPGGIAGVWIWELKGNKTVSRVYGLDQLLSLCELSNRTGWEHFFYGSTNQVLNQMPATEIRQKIRTEMAGLKD